MDLDRGGHLGVLLDGEHSGRSRRLRYWPACCDELAQLLRELLSTAEAGARLGARGMPNDREKLRRHAFRRVRRRRFEPTFEMRTQEFGSTVDVVVRFSPDDQGVE